MEKIEIQVQHRSGTRKSAVRKLRMAGQVPGVFYSHGSEAKTIQIAEADLSRVLRLYGRQSLLELKSDVGELDGQHVLIKDLQQNMINDHLLHVDLQGVDLGEEVTVAVPINFIGTPKGEKLGGGRTDHLVYEIEVVCRADSIPHELDLDVTHVEVGDVLHVSDLTLPAGVEFNTDPDIAIMLVDAPKQMDLGEESEAEGEEAAEGEGDEAAEGEGEGEGEAEEAESTEEE